jgi:hypothetical protein
VLDVLAGEQLASGTGADRATARDEGAHTH